MNTVTKDTKSDLIQLVARGNKLSNMTLVDVENDKLIIANYHQNGEKLGKLIIDKTSTQTKIEGSGVLTPLNPKGIQIHWSFDTQLNITNYKNSIEGAFPKQGKHNPLMAIITEPIVYNNDGGFNFDYALIGSSAKEATGILGNAVEINDTTQLFVLPMGPMMYGYERTLACWVKTTATGRRLILNSGSYWSKGQFFNLSINEGNLEIALRPEIYSKTQNLSINDGKWHHLAVVMPHNNAKIKDLRLYVDGELADDKQTTKPKTIINTSQANWMAVATQTETYKTDLSATMNMKNYLGLLDDFSIWTRPLSEDEIMQLYTKGLNGINALVVENKRE